MHRSGGSSDERISPVNRQLKPGLVNTGRPIGSLRGESANLITIFAACECP